MTSTHFYILSTVILFQLFLRQSLACNGYDVRIDSIENCGGEKQVLTIDPNTTVHMTNDCEVVVVGCTTSTGFQKAMVDYSVAKVGAPPMTGKEDLCAALKKSDQQTTATLQMFGLPTECPVEPGRKCTTEAQKLDISKHKNLLSLARGKVVARVNMQHDSGTTCIKMNAEIFKKRKQ